MYLRLVSDVPDEKNSNEPAGIFLVTGWIRSRAQAPAPELERLQALREWFDANLERPDRFNRSRRPNRKKKALAWFKDSAAEHIRRARAMAEIARACGYAIREVHTDRPGYIVHEDEFQIMAEPFSETPR